MATTNLWVVLLALLVGVTGGQQDLLDRFCRRHGQQTTVIDRRLYIDGGFIITDPEPNPLNYSNTALQYADLDIEYQGFPKVFRNLSKSGNVPDVNGGILWPDTVNKLFYLYGGEYSEGSPRRFTLWMYDTIYDTWNTSTSDSQIDIQRASYGAGATIQDRGVGYYYGGWLSNASVPSWGAQSPLALSTFLHYNMLENEWTNTSGPDTVGRAEGAMVYLPAGDSGLLVYLGGLQVPKDNNTVMAQPMNEILIYDIAGSKWYKQKATGDVPDGRRRFCAGATWAEDRSSYNIYVYGGLAAGRSGGFPDIYVLTLPTFTWIKWWPKGPSTGAPKHTMSCDVVGLGQMLVIGGYSIKNVTECDVPTIYAQHNIYLGRQNPEQAEWARFRPNLTEYHVPSEIISVIGGSATGGADRREPKDGFNHDDLRLYFRRTYNEGTRSPTRAIPSATSSDDTDSGSTPAGTIAGSVVGGVAGVGLIAGLLFWYFRVHRNKKTNQSAELSSQPLHPYPDERKPKPPMEPDHPPRSELGNTVLAELPSPWPSPQSGNDGTWRNSTTSHNLSPPHSPSSLPPYSTHNANDPTASSYQSPMPSQQERR
ncbi:hypothetical protein BDV25DRAFT_127561 [Aspergillus avenaceus]|uniref:Kelch repeat protein n=1 Tax=Aspergillus avenaceus TaxID=36643 RepID=A0A5N6U2W8_ASPAV|nr:hypothetical protein BDV25DRAFT_127561 [Aspergillus avenaceus]